MSQSHHIYLSPHYDDAALSCGGLIHQQVKGGQTVQVITICAAEPQQEDLSPFAKKLHQAWGSPEDVIATRRAEDQRAMAILGVDYTYLHLTDCIYRGYDSEQKLFGKLQATDAKLSLEIVEAVEKSASRSEKVVVYAPLSVGHHVDHQLTHLAARQLYQQGWLVAFYEDYPYVDPDYPFHRPEKNPHTLTVTLAKHQTIPLQPHIVSLSEEDLQAKINSVEAYASQMQMLFGDEAALRIRQYTQTIGQGTPAERFWVPESQDSLAIIGK